MISKADAEKLHAQVAALDAEVRAMRARLDILSADLHRIEERLL